MFDDLRALTVMQPHAWAIAAEIKDVENRGQRFPFPDGTTIALHAGVKVDPAGLDQPVSVPPTFDHGCVIALVDIIRCVRDSPSQWARPGSWHWCVGNVRRLAEPVPTRGQQQLFRLPSGVVTRIAASVDECF